MERESNSMQALCRSGCGFYGNPSTDGLCSLCYKEALKKKQQPPGPSPSASTQSAAQAFSAPTSNPVTTAFNTSNAKFMDTAIPTIPVVVNAQASAEKKDNNNHNNQNNGRKKLFRSENNDTTRCCSSSSSSSNSEDGDNVVCRKTSTATTTTTSLDARAKSSPYAAAARVLGAAGAAAALKGGSEAPTDLVYEYLTRDHRATVASAAAAATREPPAAAATTAAAADKIRTNLKIVRIRKFQSNESKLLLIVDVPPAVRQEQLEQRRQQQQPPPPPAEAAGGVAASRSPAAPPPEMGSREIFELSDELAKKFDVERRASDAFEWRSFSRPDDVIKLLLNEGAAKASGGPDEQPSDDGCRREPVAAAAAPSKSKTAAAVERECSSCSCAEGGAAGVEDGGLSKPATKRKRISAADERQLAVPMEQDDGGQPPPRCEGAADDEAKLRQRSRLVRGLLLGTQRTVLKACGAAKGQVGQPAGGPRATSTETTTTPAINKYRDTMVDETWKILKNCATMRRENVDTLHVLLGEDNAKGVPNCGADTSTSDANDDALNSSNSDDNDAKAKKKNRCALCRKKVGLTGFECRCGGLYCGMHRYSDKHNCTFDYRQLGAQEIRRNNPVVIGEKIQKI